MQTIGNYVLQQVQRKKLDGQVLGAIAIKEVRNFLCSFLSQEEQERIQEYIRGYIKFSTLHIQTDHQECKIQLHLQQKKIVDQVNEKFLTLGISASITSIRRQRPPAKYDG